MLHDLDKTYDKIYKYAYFKLGSIHQAEDVTQETFTRFYQQTTYTDRGKPLAYLYRIARNLCNDAYKKPRGLELSDDLQAFSSIEAIDAKLTLKMALEALDDLTRDLIVLRYSNDLSMKDITKVTGLSRFTIRRHINKGLASLNTSLKEEDFR